MLLVVAVALQASWTGAQAPTKPAQVKIKREAFVKEIDGKPSDLYYFHEAVCLATQHFPDLPDKPSASTTVLNPGQTFTSLSIYKFLPISSAGKN